MPQPLPGSLVMAEKPRSHLGLVWIIARGEPRPRGPWMTWLFTRPSFRRPACWLTTTRGTLHDRDSCDRHRAVCHGQYGRGVSVPPGRANGLPALGVHVHDPDGIVGDRGRVVERSGGRCVISLADSGERKRGLVLPNDHGQFHAPTGRIACPSGGSRAIQRVGVRQEGTETIRARRTGGAVAMTRDAVKSFLVGLL